MLWIGVKQKMVPLPQEKLPLNQAPQPEAQGSSDILDRLNNATQTKPKVKAYPT